MIDTVIRNLLTNAIKFSKEGGAVVIKSEPEGDMVMISVIDNGIGIAEENQKRLFGLENVHSTFGTKNEKGSGLGLVLCREFIERNGGKIWANSVLNQGSEFIFTVPSAMNN